MKTIKIIDENIMNLFYIKNNRLFWKSDRGSNKVKDKIAGHLNNKGYFYINLNKTTYQEHRILYQFYHNIILTENQQIDHINLDKTDNRKENLRLVSHSQNQMNRKVQKNNLSTGHKNISIKKDKYYDYFFVQIKKDRKFVYRECFRTDKFTLEEVIEIRNKKLLELHGEFARFN